jgi:putative transposase
MRQIISKKNTHRVFDRKDYFDILKSELFYLNKYVSIAQLKQDIKEYIEYYNNERIKLNLNGMSPIEYRVRYYEN